LVIRIVVPMFSGDMKDFDIPQFDPSKKKPFSAYFAELGRLSGVDVSKQGNILKGAIDRVKHLSERIKSLERFVCGVNGVCGHELILFRPSFPQRVQTAAAITDSSKRNSGNPEKGSCALSQSCSLCEEPYTWPRIVVAPCSSSWRHG